MGCSVFLNFGEVPHCAIIELPMLTTKLGFYHVKFDYGNHKQYQEFESLNIGDAITLDTSLLTENREVCFEILDPETSEVIAYNLNVDEDANWSTNPKTTELKKFHKFRILPVISLTNITFYNIVDEMDISL